VPLLYDAIALGMWASTRSGFRVSTLGVDPLPVDPGTLIVVTHRRETDIPLLCPSLYLRAGLWRRRKRRVAFAARDDLAEPGFLAGFSPGLPVAMQRLLYPLGVGALLRRMQVYPVSRGIGPLARDVLEAFADRPLDAFLPKATAASLRLRALEAELAPPRVGADVLRGEYADLLWQEFGRDALDSPELEPLWQRRAAVAATEFRGIVTVLRRGAALLVFPEGRPSPDGAVGPLLPGAEALLRLGRPHWLQPIGIAYDPLTRGRTRAHVVFPERLDLRGGERPDILSVLRNVVPLTCGQVVAHRLLRAGSRDTAALEREVEAEVGAAAADGRAVDPALEQPDGRRRRVAEALDAASRLAPGDLEYLAREYESARETAR